ncbi:hypothetical protein [Nocardioides conyzicola]|uniref:KTSC domain-containing protein n=1 Tax=Nocardioides conyzicola TaxID=1651781 RepID=A0ABP8Y1S9_9ACTN
MASRSNVTRGIQIAQLDGRARYHLNNKSTHADTMAALRDVSAAPDVIKQAADSARAAYLADPAFKFSRWRCSATARRVAVSADARTGEWASRPHGIFVRTV